MLIRWGILSLIVLVTLALGGCDPCRKLAKSKEIADKDSAAYCNYERKHYETAAFLFEELLNYYGPSPRGEKMLFMLAQSKLRSGEALTAAYHFREFVQRYPGSKNAEDAAYFIGYAYYLQSGLFDLDQTETKRALEFFEVFLKAYPESERVAEVNQLVVEMRNKLAQKAENMARQYYKLGHYKAAVVAYYNLLQDFPDADFREDATQRLAKSAVKLAENSVLDKQYERLEQARDLQERYQELFPEGKNLRELDRVLDNLEEQRREQAQEQLEAAEKALEKQDYKRAARLFLAYVDYYPDGPQQEESHFRLVFSAVQFALEGTPDKQPLRYLEAKKFYTNFANAYPDSPWVDKAALQLEFIQKQLDNLTGDAP